MREAVRRTTLELEQKKKELETESALEQVRKVALAMHKPADLLNVCKRLFKELRSLGFTQLRNALIHAFNDEERHLMDYDYSDITGGYITRIPYNSHPIVKKFIRQIKASDNAFVEFKITGNELADWKKFRIKGGQRDDPRLNKASAIYYYVYSVGNASIGISTFDIISGEKLQLLRRFRNVFDFAYRRYVDVSQAEAQAREAEIQLSLERVRARAMAMHKSEELTETSSVLFHELMRLGMHPRRSGFGIYEEDRASIRVWLTTTSQDVTETTILGNIPLDAHPAIRANYSAWQKKKPFMTHVFNGNEVKDYYRKIGSYMSIAPRKKYPAKLVFNVFFFSEGSLNIMTDEPLPEEDEKVMLRFAGVFDLTYRRFLDLQKAEAQAREAQIETALERVRSRTMAMHKSNEVMDVAGSLFDELQKLGFSFGASSIIIMDKDSGDAEYWIAGFSKNKFPESYKVKYFKHPYHDRLLSAWKKGEKFLVYTLKGEEKRAYDEVLFSKTGYKNIPEKEKRLMRGISSVNFSIAFTKHGALHWGPSVLTEAHANILQRFAQVFEQAYTRFLDLQKAEAQAREAQIETALERVRGKALAMHKSEELYEVVSALKKELDDLNIQDVVAATIYLEQDNGSIRIVDLTTGADRDAAHHLKMDRYFRLEDTDPKLWVRRMWSEKEKYFVIEVDEQDFKRVVSWLHTVDPAEAKMAERIIRKNKIRRAWLPTVKLEKGRMNIDLLQPPSPEIEQIMLKLGAGFDLAYRRFLDLQKAEAQAREAQIQLALERVRARTMAMHKSDELSEVVALLYKQFVELDFGLYQILISIINTDKKRIEWWSRGMSDKDLPQCYFIPFVDHPFPNMQMQKWRSGETYHAHILQGEIKKSWENHLFTETDLKYFPAQVKKQMQSIDRVYLSDAFMKHGVLQAAGPSPLSPDKADILIRFAKVLDQAYTRMNDLQNAEAQAREARIEAALEKVRARTMAMQKSDELLETSEVLFQQLQKLGYPAEQFTIGIINEAARVFEISATFQGSPLAQRVYSSIDEPYMMSKTYAGWKDKLKSIVIEIKGKDLAAYNRYRNKLVGEKKFPTRIKNDESWIAHIAYFSNGMLSLSSKTRFPRESVQLLERFASGFDLTYTRFLDLKKAEAQAREARIETALEKVRSRTMAMQKSDELPEAAIQLFQQVQLLGVPAWAAGYCIWDEDKKGITLWMSSEGVLEPAFHAPTTKDPSFIHFREAWERGESFFVEEIGGEELVEHYKYMRTLPTVGKILDSIIEAGHPLPTYQIFHLAYFSKGFLLFITYEPVPLEHDIFKRFGKVFEQTYGRFLDLQKAEAQARESKIEAALEKVRGRAMAMQKSDELQELIGTVSAELTKLDMVLDRSFIAIFDPVTKGSTWWMSAPEMSTGIVGLFLKYHESPPYLAYLKGWNDRKVNWQYLLEGDIKKVWDSYIFTETEFSLLPESVITNMKAQEKVFLNASFNAFGCLSLATLEPLTAEQSDILIRMAKVFDLTYTRFNDLKQAEAQARESAIQLALERVQSRAMAMQRSDELAEAAQILYQELRKINLKPFTCGYMFIDQSHDKQTGWFVRPDGTMLPSFIDFPLTGDPVLDARYNDWKAGKPLHIYELSGDANREHHNFLAPLVPPFIVEEIFSQVPDPLILHCANFSDGYLLLLSAEKFSVEEQQIVIRFAKAFEITYTRFLDLQKAEANAREAQIEAALERVRSKTMAMHNSQDVADTVSTMFNELLKLGVKIYRCGIGIMHETEPMELWTARPGTEEKTDLIIGHIDMTTHPLFRGALAGWKNKDESFSYEMKGKDVIEYYTALNKQPDYPVKYDLTTLPSQLFHNDYYFNEGTLFVFSLEPLSPEESTVLKRFAAVFGQTYRRFLDLQKAEAQAREAQIEVGLERVRAKAMAMHKSDDLNAAVSVVFDELAKLNLDVMRCGIGIMDKGRRHADVWVTTITDEGPVVQVSGDESFDIHPLLAGAFDAWESGKHEHSYTLEGQDLVDYYKSLDQTNFHLPESQLKLSVEESDKQFYHISLFEAGGLFAFRKEPFTDEAKEVMRRFASVFNLTYKRFLDIQRAEAQAREAQIEASLERVRAKAMAMHSSEELASTISTFYHEIEMLSVTPRRCGVAIMDKDTKIAELSTMNTREDGKSLVVMGHIKMEGHRILDEVFDHWLQQKEYHATLRGPEIKEYYQVLRPQIEFPDYPNDAVQYGYYFMFREGDVYAWTDQPLTEEQLKIYRRFTTVLSLTFKRYNDLKHAEAQAMEAKVEASLERVRTIAMGMKQPADMLDVCRMIADQLQILSISDIRNVQTIIIYQSKYQYINYQYFVPYDKNSIEQIDYRLHPVELELAEKMLTSKEAFYFKLFQGEELQKWRDHRRATNQLEDPLLDVAETAYYYFYSIGTGALGITTYSPLNEGALAIFKRFRNVFELAYKRYLDIEFAEAQAREAKIETALERVRARALAMQTPEELSDVAQVLRNEMGALGIEELETASIYIHEKDSDTAECWYALKDPTNNSKKMVADQFIVHLDETWVGKQMKRFYQSGEKQTSIEMKGDKRKEWIQYCYDHSPVFNGYYGEIIPDRTYHLYKFSHGYVGAAAPGDLSAESWKLLSRAASVFSLAYSRFKDLTQARFDLQRLKEEKQRAESALSELKSTQTQLIQSEKMASLGELTAGIAHEIQNPLNFVNNFSEVSNELIAEMKEELAKGNSEGAIQLVEDVKQNLNKINFHGKRADAIVKSMLQHSRKSTGQKELTDINALADEYLRLAYHGFRAKDKSFNAKFELALDESIGKMNVVPQEIGRVILNLINNAFYAVTEKKKQHPAGYEPIVSVTTMKSNGHTEIKVQDNGNGMPQQVLEKIFQPFFTTKPTGQGTGLGLSLSYDIITKGHGGDLKVNTKEGEGTEFVIQLPS